MYFIYQFIQLKYTEFGTQNIICDRHTGKTVNYNVYGFKSIQ